MRSVLFAVALALTAVCGTASAQFDGNHAGMMRVAEALMSDDPAAREAALTEVTRSPGDFPSMTFFAVAQALDQLDRNEEALRWSYFAQIRFLTEMRAILGASQELSGFAGEALDQQMIELVRRELPSPPNVPAERRRRLLQEAIRLDERTPRNYGVGDGFGRSGMPWPSREVMRELRERAIANVRASVDVEIATSEANARGDAEIAANGVMAEAAQFIPEQWRGRVRALRTVRIDDFCQTPTLTPTPRGAEPEAFVTTCVPRGTILGQGRERDLRLRWLAAGTLAQIADMRSPRPYWRSLVAVRGGMAQAVFQETASESGLSTILMAADGRISVLNNPGGVGFIQSLSPSGRYALRTTLTLEVMDLETGEVIYSRDIGPGQRRGSGWFLVEPSAGEVAVAGIERSSDEDNATVSLVVTNARTREARRLVIEGAIGYQGEIEWGENQALVAVRRTPPARSNAPTSVETYDSVEAFEAARGATSPAGPAHPADGYVETRDPSVGAALVDIETMRVVWTGARHEAPQPRGVSRCSGADPMRSAYFTEGNRAPINVLLPGAQFQLIEPERGDVTHCVFSGDGERLAIVAPPFIHLYAIGPQ